MLVAVIALLALVPAMPAFQLDALLRRDPIQGIDLLSPGNLTTCTPVALTWAYSPTYVQPDMVMNLFITNVGVLQFAPPLPQPTSSQTSTGSSTGTDTLTGTNTGSSTSFPGQFPTGTPTFLPPPGPTEPNQPIVTPPSLLVRDTIAPITLAIAKNLPVANATGGREFDWPAVAVPQGWYVIMGSSPDLDQGVIVANSSRFYVADSGDDSCISATPSASDGSGSTIATGLPSTSSHMSTGGVVGAVIGGIIAIAAIIGLIAYCVLAPKRPRRRAGGSSGPWGQVQSKDSAAGIIPGAHYGTAAARASARSLPGDDSDSLASEKLADLPPASAVAAHRSSAASAASLYKPARSRSSQPITPEAEGYALGVIGRAGVTPSPTVPPTAAAGFGKKTPRKPVPTYDPREMGSAEDDAESTAVGSHASTSGALRKTSRHTSSDDAFPFVLNGNGSTGQVHYLVPDPPPPAVR